MTSLPLVFHPGETRAAHVTYLRREFALQYALEPRPPSPLAIGPQGRIDAMVGVRPARWLGIADTVVLAFTGLDADFVALDAYTNIDLWVRAPALETPATIDTGSVHLASPPSDTDRIDLRISPRFEYSEPQARLRISFGRPGARHYRVSTCLVVGIDDEGIATLDFSDLQLL